MNPRRCFRCYAALVLALGASGCAGQCPTRPTVRDVAVLSSQCLDAQANAVPACDPLALVGGSGVAFWRADLAGIRGSEYGPLIERAFDAFLRSEFHRERVTSLRDVIARTEVAGFVLDPSHGFVLVAQGRYTEADAGAFELDAGRLRRQHTIHTRGVKSVSVAGNRYLVVSEGLGVEAALDRIDGLEDASPVSGALLTARNAMTSPQAYFTMTAVPTSDLRREFESDPDLRGVYADLRWGVLAFTQASTGIDVSGRAHTITEASATAILAKSVAIQEASLPGMDRELPALAEVARSLSLAVSGTDATLSLHRSDTQVRAFVEALTDRFERDAQLRSSEGPTPDRASVASSTAPDSVGLVSAR